jgi:mono/diheme cytochrome c family protein
MKTMYRPSSIKLGWRPGILLALLVPVIFAESIALVVAGDTNAPVASPPATNAPTAQVEGVKPIKKPVKKKLTGAELYQVNCNRCHAERYPTEFTPAQWKTIMFHMRVRANLPAAQAREILKYLQEDSGN